MKNNVFYKKMLEKTVKWGYFNKLTISSCGIMSAEEKLRHNIYGI